MVPFFRRLKQQNRVLEELQGNVSATLDQVVSSLLINAQLATFTAKAKVAHGTLFTVGNPLQRVPTGMLPLIGVVNGLFGLVSATAQAIVMICTTDIPAGDTVKFLVF